VNLQGKIGVVNAFYFTVSIFLVFPAVLFCCDFLVCAYNVCGGEKRQL